MFEKLFHLFLGFLADEASAIEEINAYRGSVYIARGALIFSLSDLFGFISSSKDEKTDYAEFQRQLYQSTLNQDLKAHGGQVVVHHSTGKVETNLYRLERCPLESDQSVSSDG